MSYNNNTDLEILNRMSQEQINMTMVEAALQGDLDFFIFLTTDSRLEKKADPIYNRCSAFSMAASHGCRNIVRHYLENDFLTNHEEVYNNAFVQSCKLGYQLIAKELLKHNMLDSQAFLLGLVNSCTHNHIEIVDMLVHQKRCVHHLQQTDVAVMNNCFDLAVKCQDFKLAQYLLSSKDLPIHADVHYNNDFVVTTAGFRGDADAVRFLVNLPNFKENAFKNDSDDNFFKNMIINCMSGSKQYLDIVHTLIFEYGIEETPSITKMMDSVPLVKNMFMARKLNENLSNNEEVHKKHKI